MRNAQILLSWLWIMLVLNVTKDRIIRMLPPLIINRSQIDEIVVFLIK